MAPFRVEVSGTWRNLALSTDEPATEVYLVAAPGPTSAQVAGMQLFGNAAAGRRCLALPGPAARVLVDESRRRSRPGAAPAAGPTAPPPGRMPCSPREPGSGARRTAATLRAGPPAHDRPRSRIRPPRFASRSTAIRRVESQGRIFVQMARLPEAFSADPSLVSVSAMPSRLHPAANLPLIAVTTSEMRHNPFDVATAQADPPRQEMVLGMRYLEAVGRAGALATVVPPMPGPMIPALLDRVDGICLSGGPDLHPDAYGAAPHPALGPTEPPLDAFELALVRAALRARHAHPRDLPRQADPQRRPRRHAAPACRRTSSATTIVHRQPGEPGQPDPRRQGRSRQPPRGDPRRDRRRGQLLPPPGLRSPRRAPVPTAWAPDGTVEGIEATDRSFVVGVQWHVECLVDRAEQAALFSALVDAAPGAGRRIGGGASQVADSA